MANTFTISAETREIVCPCEPPCNYVHRELTGVERYRLGGRFISQERFLKAASAAGLFAVRNEENGHVYWGDVANG